MSTKKLSRRDFLQFSGISAAALLSNPFRSHAMGLRTQMEPFMPDAEISITAAEKYVQILPGAQTLPRSSADA